MIDKPNYSSRWDKRRLGDVAELNPKAIKGILPNDLEVDFIPMRLVEEKTGGIAEPEKRRFNSVKQGYVSFTKNDILFAKVTPCMENGKIAIVHNLNTNIGFGSSEFHVIRVSEQILNSFLFYFLIRDKFRSEAAANMTGAVGLRRVPKQFLENYILPLPTIQEQNAIVTRIEELFSELDAGRRQLESVKEQLKTYRQAVLKSAFEGKLLNKGRNKNTPQKGWSWKRLGELIDSVEYGSGAKSEDIGKIPVLRMGNIQNGIFDWSDLVYTNDEDEISKYLLRHNDVLFNRTNSPELVGKTAIYKSEKAAIFAGYLIRINVKEELLNHEYLAYYLNSPFAKNYGSTVKTDGVNQSNINGQKLKSYPIPYCDLQQQKLVVEEIETRLLASKMLLDTIEQVLSQTEALKQVILKHAFEGKLVKTQTN